MGRQVRETSPAKDLIGSLVSYAGVVRVAEFTFSVDSALLSELGEKLVETPHVALLELVKNAYDADAKTVKVRIVPQDSGGPEVQIEDDGSGMKFDDVRRYWMRIATTHKTSDDVSHIYGRPRTGSKGIGRFSCRRLGKKLTLITTAITEKGWHERTTIKFDWKRFTPGTDVSEIKCICERERLRDVTSGTILIISGSPDDEWRTRGYNYLKRQFAVLAANRGTKRRGYQEDPGFNISVDAEGFGEELANVREQLICAGWGDLEIAVDRTGRATYTLNALKIGTKSIEYPERLAKLAGVRAHIGIMTDRKEQMRDASAISKGTLRDILPEWGGIYVRSNGFRVYPFGEPGNDWLDIDRDRAIRKGTVSEPLSALAARLKGVDPGRALLSMLSMQNHIGDVDIGTEADGFVMKASREGFVGTEGLNRLKKLVRFGIDWATVYRDYYLRIEAKEEADAAFHDFEEQLGQPVAKEEIVETAVGALKRQIESFAATLPAPERQELKRKVSTATSAILKHDRSNQVELRHLRLIASTSTLLLVFSHEVKSLLSEIEKMSLTLKGIEKKSASSEANRIAELRSGLKATKDRFVDLLEMTSLVGVDSRMAKADRLSLYERSERAADCLRLIIENYSIVVDLASLPKNILVGPMLEAELYAILLNVISNAIKSVIAAGGERRIQLSASKEAGKTTLHVRDTGLGLHRDYWEEAFTPFVSDPQERLYRGLKKALNPEDSFLVGSGSGLGLSIVREILGVRGGSVRFVEPSANWSADLEVTFP